MAGLLSPNQKNLVVGKGACLFKREGDADFFALGSVPKLTYTPNITNLDHFSPMAGTKLQDFSVITQAGGTLVAEMEEQTLNNLSLFFMGGIDLTDPTVPKINIFEQLQQIYGQFKFIATNDVGPRWYMNLTKVQIRPQGNFSPISDAWNTTGVTMSHLADDELLFGTLELHPPVSESDPENVLLPFIDGVAQQGVALQARIGVWVGPQRYAYQWKVSSDNVTFTNISLATDSRYTPVAGDVGKYLKCAVTGTNTNGNATAMTLATAAVLAP